MAICLESLVLLSEPHTSRTALQDASVCMSVCLCTCGHIPKILIEHLLSVRDRLLLERDCSADTKENRKAIRAHRGEVG